MVGYCGRPFDIHSFCVLFFDSAFTFGAGEWEIMAMCCLTSTHLCVDNERTMHMPLPKT